MPPRPIVRDLDVYHGQWRIDGTLIFVADLQRDHQRHGDAVRGPYRAMGITDDEIDAALAFTFPPVLAEPLVEPHFVSLTLHCVCGVRRQAMVAWPTLETDQCICGRTWRIPVGILPGRPPSPDGGR